MKNFNLLVFFTFIINVLNAQNFTDKVILNKDKVYEIVNSGTTKMKMPDMEMIMFSEGMATVKVGETSDTSYSLKTKIEKIKLNAEFGGNKMLMYDSEKPNGFQNPEIASALAGKIGVEKIILLNSKTGFIQNLSTIEKIDEESIEKILNPDGSENISFSEMFLLIPKAMKTGSSWTIEDTLQGFENKTTYTIKDVKDLIATVDLSGITNIRKTFSEQGSDIFIQVQSISKGNLLVNINTGVLQKKSMTIITDVANTEMGESSKIHMEATTNTLYIEK